MGVSSDCIHSVKANAAEGPPFEPEFFDAVVSIDSYNYFGRDPQYLGERLLPYVKSGGRIYLSIPGMVGRLTGKVLTQLRFTRQLR